MARAPIQVRRVDESTTEAFCDLWSRARSCGDQGSDAGGRRVTVELVRAALGRPDLVGFLATSDGATVGYAVLTDTTMSAFAEGTSVAVDQIFVLPEARRSGVARALMGAVATYADRRGAEQVVCNVPATGKDANRFFARMGFAPLVVRRVISTAALHRKLAGAAEGHRSSLEQVLARRRVARGRATGHRLASH
jgi:ribosomal protein S18 acetylase RimI-like enzyme